MIPAFLIRDNKKWAAASRVVLSCCAEIPARGRIINSIYNHVSHCFL